jgi:seryl-tRNA synthetase
MAVFMSSPPGGFLRPELNTQESNAAMPETNHPSYTNIMIKLEKVATEFKLGETHNKEAIQKNSANIGQAFYELREFKSSITNDVHGLDARQKENNKDIVKLGEDIQHLRADMGGLKNELSDLKTAVQDLKISQARISILTTLATAVLTSIIVKFFSQG